LLVDPAFRRELVRARRLAVRRLWLALASPVMLRDFVALARLARAEPSGAQPEQETLAALVAHLRRVPFYARFAADLDRDGDSRDGDPRGAVLSRLPVLRKRDLQESFADLIARDDDGTVGGQIAISRTSGSTGSPTSHLSGPDEPRWDAALFSRALRDVGAPRSGHLWDAGLSTPEAPEVRPTCYPPYRFVQWGFFTYFNDAGRRQNLAVLATTRPAVILGLPSRLLAIANQVREHDLTVRPAAVFSSYERLNGTVRQFLTDTFACPVRDLYGTAELGLCGWECRAGRIHFPPDAVIVEVLDTAGRPAPPGEAGRLVISSLKSWIMPILRYETGDLARAASGPCRSGRVWPSVESLLGRENAAVVARDGQLVPPYLLLSLLDDLGLREYQVIPRAPGELALIVPLTTDLPEGSIQRLCRQLQERSGHELAITVIPTGQFVIGPSGKREPIAQGNGIAAEVRR
jgi:phenylacetate-CoA ligase